MRSMQWQLGILGTISAFAYRHEETTCNIQNVRIFPQHNVRFIQLNLLFTYTALR